MIRPAVAADAPFIALMLLEAASWSRGRDLDVAALQDRPELAPYVDGWPRAGDLGVVAVVPREREVPPADGEPVGAAWARRFSEDAPGYGFVAADVPELSVAVLPAARGAGTGRALLAALVDAARAQGVRALSLSVEDGNRARELYASLGFVVVGRNGSSDTMLLDLGASA